MPDRQVTFVCYNTSRVIQMMSGDTMCGGVQAITFSNCTWSLVARFWVESWMCLSSWCTTVMSIKRARGCNYNDVRSFL